MEKSEKSTLVMDKEVEDNQKVKRRRRPVLKLKMQLNFRSVLFYVLSINAVLTSLTCCSWYNYESISLHDLDTLLLKAVNPNLKVEAEKLKCNYDFVKSKETAYGAEVGAAGAAGEAGEAFLPTGLEAGGFAPAHCAPQFSVAVLVTYRARQRQLDVFLPYIHNFLRKQNIHYKVYLIEQQDAGPWNKGLLYNVGARAARADGWPCLVLHDVDLLPLDAANLYACLRRPRHMSAAIDKFRYVLPYKSLSGGVLAISAAQYAAVNGFSNLFTGWGGEDDNFSARLENHKLELLRLPREMSRYSMLRHQQERPSPGRWAQRDAAGRRRAAWDGLADAAPRLVRRTAHRLFTLLSVTL